MKYKKRAKNTFLFYLPVLMVLAILTEEMATDIFLPCLPQMGHFFGVGEAKAQLTISLYLLGLCLARPFYGILSDSLGRRRPLIGGMILFFIASIGCYYAPSVEILMAARFVQGAGTGAAIVIGFAAVKDIFNEKKCAHILSLMGFVVAVAPAVAPILGGYLSKHYGWSSTFLFVLIFGGITLVLIGAFMPETLSRKKYVPLSLGAALKNYKTVLKHRRFIFYVFIQSLLVGALWTWLAGAPTLFITSLGVDVEDYGYYSAVGVLFYMLGTFSNLHLMKFFSLNRLILLGLFLSLISMGLLLGAFFLNITHPVLIQAFNGPFAVALAFLLPNSTTGALESIEEGRGVGASIIGTLQMLMGAWGSFLVGYYADRTLLPLVNIMLLMILSAGVCFIFLERGERTVRPS